MFTLRRGSGRFWMATLVLLAVLASRVHADCHLSRSHSAGYETLVMENDWIRVVIVPGSNGRIAEYTLKATGENLFSDFVANHFALIPGVELVRTNYAGYEDWIWEIGLRNRTIAYKAEVLEESPRRCAVRVVYEGQPVRFERTMTLTRNSSELAIETTITNRDTATRDFSYWAHVMVRPAPKGLLFIPAGHMERTKRLGRAILHRVAVVPDQVFVKSFRGSSSDFFTPRQGWWAMLNQGTALVQLTPLEEIGRDGAMYSWSGTEGAGADDDQSGSGFACSMETIFNAVSLAPSATKTYHTAFAACSAVRGPRYASHFLLLEVPRHNAIDKGVASLPLQISSPRVLDSCRLEVTALDDQGRSAASAMVPISRISPTEALNATATFTKLSTGPYRIAIRLLDSNGDVMDRATLLDVSLTNRTTDMEAP